MARWLLIALLFVLPAQFAAAAAAGYCAHEATPASFHLGHHVHQHSVNGDGGSSESRADAPLGASSADHGDCSGCHTSVAQLGTTTQVVVERLLKRSFVAFPNALFSSRTEQDIDRPKWTRTVLRPVRLSLLEPSLML